MTRKKWTPANLADGCVTAAHASELATVTDRNRLSPPDFGGNQPPPLRRVKLRTIRSGLSGVFNLEFANTRKLDLCPRRDGVQIRPHRHARIAARPRVSDDFREG